MYEEFYGLREKPFSLSPDPAFLFPSQKHTMALTMLEYGLMNQAPITVVTGEIGAGKTTLIRELLNRLEDDIRVGLISHTHKSFRNLLQWVSMAFGIEHRDRGEVELYENVVNFLVGEYAQGRRSVLIIDEAQNLEAGVLEELRTLSNVNADKDQVLQLVLSGQPQLRTILNRAELSQFAQRVSSSYHLGALSREETGHYIRHRTKTAGGSRDLFSEKALASIWYYSRGIPRLVNTICDTALVYGFAQNREIVDVDAVTEVVKDRRATGVGWTLREEVFQPAAGPVIRSGSE